MELELRHLRSFTVLAEERHFGKAARRLYVGQPTLSRQIRRLERQVGAQLLDRRNRPIRLTPAGAVFVEEARLTLEHADRTVERSRRAAAGQVGRLAVGAVSWAYNTVVPCAVRDLRARVPDVSIALSIGGPVELADAVREERLDVGFTPPVVDTRGLNVEPLVSEPMVAVVPEAHQLATRARVSLAELAGERFVSVARAAAPGFVDTQTALFATRGLNRTVVQEAPDFEVQLALVAAGVGVGITLASFAALRRGVAAIPLEEAAPTPTMLVIWRRADDRELTRMFLDIARNVA